MDGGVHAAVGQHGSGDTDRNIRETRSSHMALSAVVVCISCVLVQMKDKRFLFPLALETVDWSSSDSFE